MTRRTLLSTFIALVVLTVASLMGSTAHAQQNPNCCTYTVEIRGVRDACFPITLATIWTCLPHTLFNSYRSNGVFVQPLPFPSPTPCPPAAPCLLSGISLDNATFVGPNKSQRYMIGNCCYLLHYGFDPLGCIYITIDAVPCLSGEG